MVKKYNKKDGLHFLNECIKMEIIRELYQRNYERLYRMAYTITKDKGAAEDAVHDAFVKAINGLESVRSPDKLDSWIYVIVRNEALGSSIKKKRIVFTDYGDESFASTTALNIPEEWIIRREDRKFIVETIECMKPALKEVIYLRYYAGLNLKEISVLLGKKQSTIRMRYLRAKRCLYRNLWDRI